MKAMSFLIKNYKEIIIFNFLFFLISIFFNIKKFVLAFDFPINEFNSIFLYFSDLTLLFFIFTVCFYLRKRIITFDIKFNALFFYFFILLFFLLGLNIFLAENKILALEYGIRFVLLINFFLSLVLLLKNGIINFGFIFKIIFILGLLQSFLGIFQFLKGESLGLNFLGEPVLNQFFKGVARHQIFVFSFLRSVGTFPHANIYAAFLVLVLLSFYYIWFFGIKKESLLKRIFLGFSIFFVFLSLVYTFSRSGWLAAFLLSIFVLSYSFFNKKLRNKALFLSLILIFYSILIIEDLDWLIRPRFEFVMNSLAINYRLIYNQIGFEIFKENPFGIGFKNQVIYATNNFYYQNKGLIDRIDFQPIHNIFLLFLTEGGVLIFLWVLIFLSYLFFLVIKKEKFSLFKDINFIFSSFLFLIFLFLGFSDHYFLTLQSGRLMFVLVLGLVFSKI